MISYFREGCTPKEYVDQLFEEAKADVQNNSTRIEVTDILGANKLKA